MLLPNNTSLLQLVTAQAVTVDCYAKWADKNLATGVVTPGSTNSPINTATTTSIVGSPASGEQRNIRYLNIRNKHASSSVDITVQHNDGSTTVELHKVTLGPGAVLTWTERLSFYVIPAGVSFPLLTTAETSQSQRILRSSLPVHSFAAVGGFQTLTGVAYFVYLGRATRDLVIPFVETHVTTAGTGAQTAEIGLFSTTAPPNKSAQTLTKIVATGTVDALTATGMKRNTAAFTQVIPAGTHVWAGFRTAMATAQPFTYALEADHSEGHVLTTTGLGALTALATTPGSLVAIGTGVIAPELRGALD